ncbi:hypothetical protein [Neisseria gonorrhoeae]|nr:hypothetical protein [Neisseria gonorrhoeae]
MANIDLTQWDGKTIGAAANTAANTANLNAIFLVFISISLI